MCACFAFASAAHADLASCKKAKKAALEACDAAIAKANAEGSAKAAQSSAACNKKDAQGNPVKGVAECAGELNDSGSVSNAALQTAIGSCDTQKKSCDSACDPAKAKPKEKSPIAEEKKSCDTEIKAKMSALKAGQAGGAQAQKGGEATKNEAQSGYIPPFSMPKSDDSSGSGDQSSSPQSTSNSQQSSSSTQPASSSSGSEKSKDAEKGTAAWASNCSDDQAAYDSRCTSELSAKCNQVLEKNSPVCKSFRSAYCTKNGGMAPASLGDNAIKPASGNASEFCLGATSSDWCDADSSRAECPSCRKKRNLPVLAGVSVDVCGSDPDYLAKAVASGMKAQSAIGAAAVGGGGGSTANGAAADQASLGNTEKVHGEESKREELGMGVDSAGAGGGSSGGSSYSSDYTPQSYTGGAAAGAGRAVASNDVGTVAGTTDVQGQFGPNVFSILGEVFRNLCQNGRAMHCVPSKK